CACSRPQAPTRPRLGSHRLVSGTRPDPAQASRRRCSASVWIHLALICTSFLMVVGSFRLAYKCASRAAIQVLDARTHTRHGTGTVITRQGSRPAEAVLAVPSSGRRPAR